MKIKIPTYFISFALCLALSAGAQAKSKSEMKHSKTTLTGCLEQGTQPNTFMLNNASSGKTGKSGSNQPSEMARSENDSYTLIPESSNVNLQQFLGQRVTVSGNFAENQSAANQTESSSMNASDFMVASIHKTSGSCQNK
jgi:hypothetical protein